MAITVGRLALIVRQQALVTLAATVLARTSRLDDVPTAAALAAARNNGFDVKRLVRTPRTEPGPR